MLFAQDIMQEFAFLVVQRQIDALVNASYGLKAEKVAVVEGGEVSARVPKCIFAAL